jgi:hypothetical protein
LAGFFNILSSLFSFIQQILPDGFLLPIYLNAVFSFIYLLKFTSAMSSRLFPVNESLSKSWDKLNRAEQNEIATTLAGKHKYIPRLARYKPI